MLVGGVDTQKGEAARFGVGRGLEGVRGFRRGGREKRVSDRPKSKEDSSLFLSVLSLFLLTCSRATSSMGVSPTLSWNKGNASTTRPETDGGEEASTPTSAGSMLLFEEEGLGGLPTSTPSTSLEGCFAAWSRIFSRAEESTS